MSKHNIDNAAAAHEVSATPVGGSDKAFGFVFGAFFAILALYPLIKGSPVRSWALLLAAVFTSAAVLRPQLLAPLNRLWIKLGLALNRVVSPVALFLVYCLAIVPTAWVLRALGKDPLRLRMDPQAKTYWIQRSPPGRADEQMKRQF